jgi:hypothetical protein
MATSISGNVRLVYGNHVHSETYSTTASTLTNANESHDYAAGGSRAVAAANQLQDDTLNAAEGLLLIKNTNNYGSLSVSVDGGSNYDVSIPAGLVNLISVGPDHAVYVKCPTATESGAGVTNVNSNTNDYLVEISAQGTGIVYELDGVTKKDLTADYSGSSTVNLVYFAGYRYTLTEA